MSLTKNDLQQIENIVTNTVTNIVTDAITGSESRLEAKINGSEARLERKINALKVDLTRRIDELAVATAAGFTDVDKQFKQVRVDILDLKARVMDTASRSELYDLRSRVEQLEQKFK